MMLIGGIVILLIKVIAGLMVKIPFLAAVPGVSFIANMWFLYSISVFMIVMGIMRDWRIAGAVSFIMTILLYLGGVTL